MWLLKKLSPDCKTIADFRKDNLQPLQQVCRALTLLSQQWDVFAGDLVAVAGSTFTALNNRTRHFPAEKLSKALVHSDAKMAEYLQALDSADSQTPSRPALRGAELPQRIAQETERKQHQQELQQALIASAESQISLTDRESRTMPVAQGVDVCYKVEMVLDSKHKLSVTPAVTPAVTDKDHLAAMATAAKQVLEVEQ
jgi:hypothetical protein